MASKTGSVTGKLFTGAGGAALVLAVVTFAFAGGAVLMVETFWLFATQPAEIAITPNNAAE